MLSRSIDARLICFDNPLPAVRHLSPVMSRSGVCRASSCQTRALVRLAATDVHVEIDRPKLGSGSVDAHHGCFDPDILYSGRSGTPWRPPQWKDAALVVMAGMGRWMSR